MPEISWVTTLATCFRSDQTGPIAATNPPCKGGFLHQRACLTPKKAGVTSTIVLSGSAGRNKKSLSLFFFADAEVGPAHEFIVHQHIGWTFQHDAAGFHYVSVVRNLEGVVHVLAHQQDGHALAGDVGDEFKNLIDQFWGEAK